MLKIPKIKQTCEDTFVCLGKTEYADYARDTDEVVYKAKNDNFDVTLNGNPCEVRECRVSAMPFNRPWPGKQRPYDQTESAGFISFSADETVEVSVKSQKAFEKAIIRPLSKNVSPHIEKDEVVFTLQEPGNYVLELDDTHNVLHIFFNPVKTYENAEKATRYFGPGMHFPGVIYLNDNDTVYIDEEAIVFGSINTLGAKNVKIFGGGIIDNSCEERIVENAYENFTKGTFRIYNCENIDVSDIILTNSCTWSMSMFNCKNINIDNVKIVGQWRYNTDGIDVVNSENVTIKNCFIRSFDDTISIKAIYNYPKPIQNITAENCVMWCGWGKNCEIGIETSGIEYKNITFKNCDLIHNAGAALCISNGCYADMHDILFENMRVELQSDTMSPVLQCEDKQKYAPETKYTLPHLVLNSNATFGIRQKSTEGPKRKVTDIVGKIHDVHYKNIQVFTDDDNVKPGIVTESRDPDTPLKNFTFENISINGTQVTDFNRFNTSFTNAQNIIIK